MAIDKDKKNRIVEKVEKAAKEAGTLVFVNFHGSPVGDTTKLRKALIEDGIGYTVAKKTLIKLALAKQNIEGAQPALEGEIAIAYGADLIAPARDVYEFQKKNKGKISIVGGIFDGVYKNKEEMLDIAAIPGIEMLRGMFVNIVNAPIQGLVGALGQIAERKT